MTALLRNMTTRHVFPFEDDPESVVDYRGFLNYCCLSKPQLKNSLQRWDYLYDYCSAEYCEIRRRLFYKAHGCDISTVNSVQLCFTERYTACVNFKAAKDGLVRHVCDMLPLVIGSKLDRRVRRLFWEQGEPAILEDVPKIGFIIQNKNYYNFTSCLTTNPKVCHIYRRNTKLQNTEVRLYFYDYNFRGNKLHSKQTLVFEKCQYCDERTATANTDSDQYVSDDVVRANCRLQIYVQEMLMLRDSYKHDYCFLVRKCVKSEEHKSVQEMIAWICGFRSDQLKRRPTCHDIFSQGGTTKTLKYQYGKTQNSLVLCDCTSKVLMQEYMNWRAEQTTQVLQFENVDKMIELNDTCFVDSAAHDRSRAAVIDKMFTLFIYMH